MGVPWFLMNPGLGEAFPESEQLLLDMTDTVTWLTLLSWAFRVLPASGGRSLLPLPCACPIVAEEASPHTATLHNTSTQNCQT